MSSAQEALVCFQRFSTVLILSSFGVLLFIFIFFPLLYCFIGLSLVYFYFFPSIIIVPGKGIIVSLLFYSVISITLNFKCWGLKYDFSFVLWALFFWSRGLTIDAAELARNCNSCEGKTCYYIKYATINNNLCMSFLISLHYRPVTRASPRDY